MRDRFEKYESVEAAFEQHFGRPCDAMFSSPGRSELGGNHTDHQRGRVIACSVDLYILAAVSLNGENKARVISAGHPEFEIDLSDTSFHEEEKGTTAALVRGIAAGFQEHFRKLGGSFEQLGFDMYAISGIPEGSGLSSSAAFEMLICAILNELYCEGRLSQLEMAKIGQFSENSYFGKPCGLMDQLACGVGGIVEIDFANPDFPEIEKIDIDFKRFGHALCIIETRSSHIGANDSYASVAEDMCLVASSLGKSVLREVDPQRFMDGIPRIRGLVGDRAVLRAMHFFDENKRVLAEVESLAANDFHRFLELVKESGASSIALLQNIFPTGATRHQPLMMALALAQSVLGDRGAARVHGGGFGGTAQAFVPFDLLDVFTEEIDRVFGIGSCHVLDITDQGCIRLGYGGRQ